MAANDMNPDTIFLLNELSAACFTVTGLVGLVAYCSKNRSKLPTYTLFLRSFIAMSLLRAIKYYPAVFAVYRTGNTLPLQQDDPGDAVTYTIEFLLYIGGNAASYFAYAFIIRLWADALEVLLEGKQIGSRSRGRSSRLCCGRSGGVCAAQLLLMMVVTSLLIDLALTVAEFFISPDDANSYGAVKDFLVGGILAVFYLAYWLKLTREVCKIRRILPGEAVDAAALSGQQLLDQQLRQQQKAQEYLQMMQRGGEEHLMGMQDGHNFHQQQQAYYLDAAGIAVLEGAGAVGRGGTLPGIGGSTEGLVLARTAGPSSASVPSGQGSANPLGGFEAAPLGGAGRLAVGAASRASLGYLSPPAAGYMQDEFTGDRERGSSNGFTGGAGRKGERSGSSLQQQNSGSFYYPNRAESPLPTMLGVGGGEGPRTGDYRSSRGSSGAVHRLSSGSGLGSSVLGGRGSIQQPGGGYAAVPSSTPVSGSGMYQQGHPALARLPSYDLSGVPMPMEGPAAAARGTALGAMLPSSVTIGGGTGRAEFSSQQPPPNPYSLQLLQHLQATRGTGLARELTAEQFSPYFLSAAERRATGSGGRPEEGLLLDPYYSAAQQQFSGGGKESARSNAGLQRGGNNNSNGGHSRDNECCCCYLIPVPNRRLRSCKCSWVLFVYYFSYLKAYLCCCCSSGGSGRRRGSMSSAASGASRDYFQEAGAESLLQREEQGWLLRCLSRHCSCCCRWEETVFSPEAVAAAAAAASSAAQDDDGVFEYDWERRPGQAGGQGEVEEDRRSLLSSSSTDATAGARAAAGGELVYHGEGAGYYPNSYAPRRKVHSYAQQQQQQYYPYSTRFMDGPGGAFYGYAGGGAGAGQYGPLSVFQHPIFNETVVAAAAAASSSSAATVSAAGQGGSKAGAVSGPVRHMREQPPGTAYAGAAAGRTAAKPAFADFASSGTLPSTNGSQSSDRSILDRLALQAFSTPAAAFASAGGGAAAGHIGVGAGKGMADVTLGSIGAAEGEEAGDAGGAVDPAALAAAAQLGLPAAAAPFLDSAMVAAALAELQEARWMRERQERKLIRISIVAAVCVLGALYKGYETANFALSMLQVIPTVGTVEVRFITRFITSFVSEMLPPLVVIASMRKPSRSPAQTPLHQQMAFMHQGKPVTTATGGIFRVLWDGWTTASGRRKSEVVPGGGGGAGAAGAASRLAGGMGGAVSPSVDSSERSVGLLASNGNGSGSGSGVSPSRSLFRAASSTSYIVTHTAGQTDTPAGAAASQGVDQDGNHHNQHNQTPVGAHASDMDGGYHDESGAPRRQDSAGYFPGELQARLMQGTGVPSASIPIMTSSSNSSLISVAGRRNSREGDPMLTGGADAGARGGAGVVPIAAGGMGGASQAINMLSSSVGSQQSAGGPGSRTPEFTGSSFPNYAGGYGASYGRYGHGYMGGSSNAGEAVTPRHAPSRQAGRPFTDSVSSLE